MVARAADEDDALTLKAGCRFNVGFLEYGVKEELILLANGWVSII